MTADEENTWRALKDQIPIVTSFWCKFGLHKWTKWETKKEAKKYEPGDGEMLYIEQRKCCIHCNTIREHILKFKTFA